MTVGMDEQPASFLRLAAHQQDAREANTWL